MIVHRDYLKRQLGKNYFAYDFYGSAPVRTALAIVDLCVRALLTSSG
jgi:hypothetical protein